MKITIYEFLGMIKDSKASDMTTNFMFDRKKYNLLAFLDEYTLDINSLNWEIEILKEEKKIPEKLDVISWDKCIHGVTHKEKELAIEINKTQELLNQVLDYLKSKGE